MGVFDVLSKVTGGGDDRASASDAEDATDDGAVESTDPTDLEPANFREGAEMLAGRSDVPELDFTEASLPDLDSIATGNHPVEDPVVYGSYLGETLVREYDGEWVREDDWVVAVDLGDDRTTVAVFDAARMALERGPVFEQVAEQLHAQGDPCADSSADEQVATDEDPHVEAGDAPSEPTDDGQPDSEGEEADSNTDADADMAATPADSAAATEPSADDETDADGDREADDVGIETTESTTESADDRDAPEPTDDVQDATDESGDGVAATQPDEATDDEDASEDGPDSGDESVVTGSNQDVDRRGPTPETDEPAAASDQSTAPDEVEGRPHSDDRNDAGVAAEPADGTETDEEGTDAGPRPDPVSGTAAVDQRDDESAEEDVVTGTADTPAVTDDDDGEVNVETPVDSSTVGSEPPKSAEPEQPVDSTADDEGEVDPSPANDASIDSSEPVDQAPAAGSDEATDSVEATTEAETEEPDAPESNGPEPDVTEPVVDDPERDLDQGDDAADERDAEDVADEEPDATPADDESATADGDEPAEPDGVDADTGPASVPSRSDYEAAAIGFTESWPDREFDYSPESLARLDTFLDDQWEGRFRPGSLDDTPTDPTDASGPLVQVGAYVGEVLVRHYDGEWVRGEDGEAAVAVAGRHGRRETFPVFAATRRSLVHPARLAYEVDALANRLDVEQSASGAEETGFALGDGGPGTAASSADVITTLVDRAESFAEAWPSYNLDYGPASLARLDHLVAREVDTEAFASTTLGDRTDADALRLADRAAGASAYFAAVLVRHLDAKWEVGDEVALSVEGPAGVTRVVPFQEAVDCLRGKGRFMLHYDRVHDAVRRETRAEED